MIEKQNNSRFVLDEVITLQTLVGRHTHKQKMADCGNMLQYQAGQVSFMATFELPCGRWRPVKIYFGTKDTGPHVGQIANWNVKTSCAGGTPNRTINESWIRYGIC